MVDDSDMEEFQPAPVNTVLSVSQSLFSFCVLTGCYFLFLLQPLHPEIEARVAACNLAFETAQTTATSIIEYFEKNRGYCTIHQIIQSEMQMHHAHECRQHVGCKKCGKKGHYARDCPNIIKLKKGFCFYCGLPETAAGIAFHPIGFTTTPSDCPFNGLMVTMMAAWRSRKFQMQGADQEVMEKLWNEHDEYRIPKGAHLFASLLKSGR